MARQKAEAISKWWKTIWDTTDNPGTGLGVSAKIFILTQLLGGLPLFAYAIRYWHSENLLRFACFFAVASASSLLKVRLPGIEATMSANFLFILVGIVDLSWTETILMGCFGGLVQSLWQSKPRPHLIQVLFNFANLAISIAAAEAVFHSGFAYNLGLRWPLLLAAAATAYFAMNTLSVSAIIAMTESKNPITIWNHCYLWSLPYYLLGAMIAAGLSILNRKLGWQAGILILPLVYWIYRSYQDYLDRLAAEKKHTAEIADLHLRTIEALSLAIEAKDHTTHHHLRRVERYAVQIGQDLGLSEMELNAIRAAAMLHDIGKLAVPEQILSKPGRLTPEEFEKMKIHPVVGAAILERVKFPYPVVPIVRSHHEKWNGTGYPDGLAATAIPIGARILSVVDCFDAMTSERPYRRALAPKEVMAYLQTERGVSFDPRVVECLASRCAQMEKEMEEARSEKRVFEGQASSQVAAPAAGLAEIPNEGEVRSASFLSSIVSARQEAQLLFELAQTLGNSLSLRETLSVVAVRLKEMIPHDSIVFYVYQDGKLIPSYVHGVDYELFKSLEIPFGQGIAGWVAEKEEPIVNGDPMAETNYLNDSNRSSVLQSALSVPLKGRDRVAGVLSLYLRQKQGFSKDHLRLLLAASSKLGLSVENALHYEKAQNTASTDFLTGLPNARTICLCLEKEISRANRSGETITVLLCDLNGFKNVNDSLGHLVGNQLLREIAAKVRNVCREYDQVGRFGGDEFVFILPNLDQEALETLQERISLAIEDAGRLVCQSSMISVSVGSAAYPQDGSTAEELLSNADTRMYEAKEKHYQQGGEARRPAVKV